MDQKQLKRAIDWLKTPEGQKFFAKMRRRIICMVKLGRIKMDDDYKVDLNKV